MNRKVSLLFPTLEELLEFQSITELDNLYINKAQLMISGYLPEREIELAFNVYQAKIIEEAAEDN